MLVFINYYQVRFIYWGWVQYEDKYSVYVDVLFCTLPYCGLSESLILNFYVYFYGQFVSPDLMYYHNM